MTQGANVTDQSSPVAGRTFKWTFDDGPTSGKTYEHMFSPDGTVVWREVDTSGNAASAAEKKTDAGKSNGKTHATKYASYEVAPNTFLVSYLSESGYTLSVVMNLDTMRIYGIASNTQEWYPLTGTADTVP